MTMPFATLGAQEEVARFLAALDGEAHEIVTTHISVVLLGRRRVYKLKRAVRFPYLDFSTPSLRLNMCEREVSLNRRFAAKLYLGARRVTREADGALALDGAGELVDAVVVMRRFESDALLETIAHTGRLTKEMIEALARRVAQTHDVAAPNSSSGGAAGMRKILDGAATSLRASALAPDAWIDQHLGAMRGALESQALLLDARRGQGKVRQCHGDLTLRNICLFEDEPTPFDCLEFDDDMATIDVLYDLAFLLMDLWRVEARDFANLALNRYLDARDESDGLPLLPIFLSLRAAIRAHVEASQGEADIARRYLELSHAAIAPSRGAIVAIGGYSGSGKSSVAAALAPRIGSAPGARSLNNEHTQKRMFGVAPTDRLPEAAYASDVSAKVYRELLDAAARVAAAGWPVIVDAVLDRPQDQAEVEALARNLGVSFLGVWLELDFARRAERVAARVNDVSDATRDVLVAQAQRETGTIAWSRFDAAQSVETIVLAIEAALPPAS